MTAAFDALQQLALTALADDEGVAVQKIAIFELGGAPRLGEVEEKQASAYFADVDSATKEVRQALEVIAAGEVVAADVFRFVAVPDLGDQTQRGAMESFLVRTVERANESVVKAQAHLDAEREKRDELICSAVQRGVSMYRIAQALGFSQSSIQRIVGLGKKQGRD